MKTTRHNRPLLAALALASVGLWATPASAQSTLLRYDSSWLSYWYPAPSQPLYIDLVGHGLNGRSFNGKTLDGHLVTAVSLTNAVLPSGQVHDLELVDTQFGLAEGAAPAVGKAKAKLNKNKVVAPVGLVLSASLDDGDQVLLRVDAVAPASAASTAYLRYLVSYAGEGGWQPLCGHDADGQPVYAIPLNGQWDYREGVQGGGDFLNIAKTFTFACEGHVLAKCVDMGYAPWADGKLCDAQGQHCTATTLAPWHQACTRAMRADYCGDGLSWTQDGTMVAVFDGIGIRADQDAWQLEAEWDEHGARCAVRDRIPQGIEPPCLAALELPTCGQPMRFADGTRLMSEVPQ